MAATMVDSRSAATLEFVLFLRARIFQSIDFLGSKLQETPALKSFLTLISTNGWSYLTVSFGLLTLCTAGILSVFGKAFSRWTLNNWTSDKWDWGREVVLITGGCSGIGEQIAHKFANRSIKVVVLDIVPPKDAMPANVYFYKCDITSPEAVHDAARHIRENVGSPSILINNAGIGSAKPLLDETNEEIQRTFDVNIVAHFWIVREFLPHMIQRNHGHIVTVASIASFMTIASNVSYSCTKAAALSFHEGLAQELRHRYDARKVRTSVIHPTWVRTPLIEKQINNGRWNSRTIEADAVAEAVVSHILHGESGQLFLPAVYAPTSFVKGFPNWLQESIRNSQSEVLRIGH